MATYDVYLITYGKQGEVARHFRLNLDTNEIEVYTAKKSDIREKPVFNWYKSSMSLMDLLMRCQVRWWLRNGSGATLLAKNVRFKQ